MKIVLQRVSSASVTVDGNTTGEIGKGYVVLLGIGAGDNKAKVEKMVDKLQKLRIFPDENSKTNLSIENIRACPKSPKHAIISHTTPKQR